MRQHQPACTIDDTVVVGQQIQVEGTARIGHAANPLMLGLHFVQHGEQFPRRQIRPQACHPVHEPWLIRSEEHTSELQSLMRISYAVFCLKKKKYLQIQQLKSQNNTMYKLNTTKLLT